MKNRLKNLHELSKKRLMTMTEKLSQKKKLLFMGRGTRVRKK